MNAEMGTGVLLLETGRISDAVSVPPVTVKAIEPNKRIVIEWTGYNSPTIVEWIFAPQDDGTTFVSITEAGFTGDGDELVEQVTSSIEGFSLVLAGLRPYSSTMSD